MAVDAKWQLAAYEQRILVRYLGTRDTEYQQPTAQHKH